MAPVSTTLDVRQVPVLLRGEAESINAWIERPTAGRVLLYVALIFAGAGMFGAAMGCWRAPLQAFYTALKFPLILLLITLGNGLLNAMLAPLLGLNISFRQSLLAILMSFTIAALILGSFSPLMLFLVWNMPPMTTGMRISSMAYNVVQLSQVAVIAFAGVAANVRLMQLLRRLSGSKTVARRVLFAWLLGNLFLGTQLTWILRPLIGSPHLPVEFLRPNAFQGNFYETVFRALQHLLTS